ncbi:MAG: prepilin-type N-terminal cleavage/methylation domain-containing protein [Pyrinomonadaceae bacterium]
MKKTSNQKGVSLVELIFVLVITGIMTGIAVVSYSSSRKYAADDQARQIVDLLDEARQKSLNQRNTMRVEINKTKNIITLIDENDSNGVTPVVTNDRIIRSLPISTNATVGAAPNNVSAGPTATSPIPVPSYTTSTYPLSTGDQKITLRFRSNGQVVDAGTDNVGTGSVITGATIYVYSTTASGTNPDVIRAVTVLGTSGDTAIYKCQVTGSSCGAWSR